MTLDPKVLTKIKKCLALAGSDNPNEAATAMRQAQALMDKHGLTTQDITMSDLGESRSKSQTMARNKPAQWEMQLAAVVGQAFGCRLMFASYPAQTKGAQKNFGAYVFVGLTQQAAVAGYTATVLIRKCKRARAAWIAEHFDFLTSGVKGGKRLATRMGDAYAEGWIARIAQQVRDFAQPSQHLARAIDNYVAEVSTNLPAEARQRKPSGIAQIDQLAMQAGMLAAAEETIYRPMAESSPPPAISNLA